MSIKYQHPFLRYEVAAHHLLLSGVLLIVAFSLQTHLLIRAGQVLLAMLLAKFSGKRISYLYFLSFCFTIILAHLLIPVGRVLLRIGPFSITEGALLLGVEKAVYILGFVFISLFAVRSDLALPGRFGDVVARTLRYYDALLGFRREVQAKNFAASLSSLLEKTYDAKSAESRPVAALQSTKRGLIFLICLEVLFFALLLFRSMN